MGQNLEAIVFFVLAATISVFSIMTVCTNRIVRSATYLLFVLLATAGFYFMMGYTFLGAVQIMVYAGGIVVLYVFSILLTSGNGDNTDQLKGKKLFAGLIAAVTGGVIVLFITLKHSFLEFKPEQVEVSIQSIGNAMLGTGKYGYILPFEAVSVLLLACIIGGILIARKR